MIILAGAILGAILGQRSAARQGGTTMDRVQYAAASAIAGGLLGLIATIVIERLS